MEAIIMSHRAASTSAKLTYITSIILLGFLSIGIPFAFLPQHLSEHLGFGSTWIGILIGAQSVVTLLTRHFAGSQADLKGPKVTVLKGLLITAVAGLVTMLSLPMQSYSALTTLFVSRAVLGVGESLMITGALSWGIGLLGPSNSGRLMSWSGIAMYTSIAVSASLSAWLLTLAGPSGVVGLSIAAPFLALGIAIYTPAVAPAGTGRSLSAIGFAAIAGFSGLYFRSNGWEYAPAMMGVFGALFVAARIIFGQMPDQYGGKLVGGIAAMIEALGLLLIWLAPGPMIAVVGAGLTGFGYSLVFPSFGVEAVRKIEPQFRGVGIGAYVAFFDLALGVTGPLAGLIAAVAGLSAVFVFGVISCLIAAAIARNI